MIDELKCDAHLGDHTWGFDCKVYPRCRNGQVYCGLLGVYCYKCEHENISRNFEAKRDEIARLRRENESLRAEIARLESLSQESNDGGTSLSGGAG